AVRGQTGARLGSNRNGILRENDRADPPGNLSRREDDSVRWVAAERVLAFLKPEETHETQPSLLRPQRLAPLRAPALPFLSGRGGRRGGIPRHQEEDRAECERVKSADHAVKSSETGTASRSSA